MATAYHRPYAGTVKSAKYFTNPTLMHESTLSNREVFGSAVSNRSSPLQTNTSASLAQGLVIQNESA